MTKTKAKKSKRKPGRKSSQKLNSVIVFEKLIDDLANARLLGNHITDSVKTFKTETKSVNNEMLTLTTALIIKQLFPDTELDLTLNSIKRCSRLF
jgi:hypothetical protein